MVAWLSEQALELNTREWAILIWLAVLMAFAFTKADVRRAAGELPRRAFAPKVAAVLVLYLAWIIGLVILATRHGLWRPELVKGTVVWSVTSGLALVFSSTEAATPGYFRRKVGEAIGLVVFMEYVFTLATFPFWIEMVMQPLAFFFAAAPAVVDGSDDQHIWQRVSATFFSLLGLAMLAHTGRTLFIARTAWDWELMVLEAIWPVLLALWVLVYVWAVAVLASYEQAFLRLNLYSGREKASWRSKIGLFFSLKLNLRWLHDAAKGGTFHVARADTASGAYRAAQEFKARRIADERREAEYAANLVRFAGADEVDERGRPRDRREFRETTGALRWLHACQMGWYRRETVGYKPALIERFRDDFSRHGLPTPSGISLVVSKDGRKWYAWRRTAGGRYFAIGAAGPPPDEWLHDGTTPPQGFPGLSPEWGDGPFSETTAPNWFD